MYDWRKRYITIACALVCALLLVMFMGMLADKENIKKEPSETESHVSSEYETETNSETEAESEAETEKESEAEPETEAEKESEVEPETEVESESEKESQTEIESESKKPIESEKESESETQIEIESEIESEIEKSSWVKDLDVAKKTTQMIVVAASGNQATVSMHRKDAEGVWEEIFSVKGCVGKNGVGKEKEGDKKTPSGVFRFTNAFGICEDPGVSTLTYLQVDDTHHWVDDSKSKYYNQLVSTREAEVDWTSSEHLVKSVPAYNYVLALNYNETCTPGLGSAIFLHCPSGRYNYTSGCIAIPEENMVQVMRLLQSDCVIIIDAKENIFKY